MKVIELALIIMAAVAAQAYQKYYVWLSSQIGPETRRVGFLRLTQNGQGNPVQIDANIRRLPSGWHRFEVHEINENTTNCNSLGPMVDLGFDTLFDLLDEYIDSSGTSNSTKVTRSLTLEWNKPRTLIGRAIAFFQEPMLEDFIASEHSHLSVACGPVLTMKTIMQRKRYYEQKMAAGAEHNVADTWY